MKHYEASSSFYLTRVIYIQLQYISGKASSFEEEDGTGTGTSEIRVQLGRGDLGNRLTCRSENEALPSNQPLQKSVQVDINCK